MSDIVEFYCQQAENNQASVAWLADLQKTAAGQLAQRGFPDRHDEDWKYTNTKGWAQQRFTASPDLTSYPFTAEMDVLPDDIILVDVSNGEFDMAQLNALNLPKQCICLPLDIAAQQHSKLVSQHLNASLKSEHGFHYLNTASLASGLFLYVPDNVIIDKPIFIRHRQNQMGLNAQFRHVFVLGSHSNASVVELYQGAEQLDYFTNTITEVSLEDSAQLVHYKAQCESKSAYHIGHTAVNQATKSQYHNHSLSLGGALVRSDLTINLNAEHASCLMNGIYAPENQQHVDHHTTVNHCVPECESTQDYKGIIQDSGRGVFNGCVVVRPGAMKTVAHQQNKNLLLSPKAEIDTKPQLEIFADDVVCSHGATVGQLDEEALFYMATRGIDKDTARRYLINAFAGENISCIPNVAIRDWMMHLLNQQLG